MKRILLALALAAAATGASAQVTFSGGTDQAIVGVLQPERNDFDDAARADRRQARRFDLDHGRHADGDLPGL